MNAQTSSSSSRTQLRGVCQCCGRQQAVVGGLMSKHGYTVQDGWFSGICPGQRVQPLQKDRSVCDGTIASVSEEVAAQLALAADLKAGVRKPALATTGRMVRVDGKLKEQTVPFAEATESQQAEAVRISVWRATRRAEQGAAFVAHLQQMIATFHGQPLLEVVVEAAAPAVRLDERRQAPRGVLTVTNVNGARVHWRDDRGFRSWTGVVAWRKLPLVD